VKEATAIVLAGGRSTRMGQNKALLPLKGRPLIGHIIGVLREIFQEILIVSNQVEIYKDMRVKVIPDLVPGKGPLSGIHSGLFHSSTWYNFLVACDMPFLDQEFILYLLERSRGFEALIPSFRDRLQPLHAVYTKGCLPVVESFLIRTPGGIKVEEIFPHLKVFFLKVETLDRHWDFEKIFFNINTPEDLKKAQKMAEGEKTYG